MKQTTNYLRLEATEWWHNLPLSKRVTILKKRGFTEREIDELTGAAIEMLYEEETGEPFKAQETASSNDSLEDRKKEQIKDYLKNLIEYLDGNGLVISDDELIDEGLNECGEFEGLRNILSSDKYKTAHDDLNNHYHELAQENIRLKKALEEIAECDYLPLDKHDAKGFIAIAKKALQKAKQL